MSTYMEDVLVTRKTAELAKDKGFNGKCFGGYVCNIHDNPMFKHTDGKFESLSYRTKETLSADWILAPTQGLLQKWLREVKFLQVYAYSHTVNGNGKYRDYVAYINGVELNDSYDEEFQTYEEALEFGLYTALTRI